MQTHSQQLPRVLNHDGSMAVFYSTNSRAAYRESLLIKDCSENTLQDDAHAELLVCSLLTDV